MTAETSNARGLVAKWRGSRMPDATDPFDAGCNYTLTHCADELEAALAAEGVQAGEVEQRLAEDRELLEAIREAMGGGAYDTLPKRIAALSQQPEARGVVDAALQRAAESVRVPPKMTATRGEYFKAGARAMIAAMNRELAALTEARNVR